MEWGPIIITFKLALLTTIILVLISIPLAYWLSQTKIKVKPAIEALISMPLVLPPTVIGFYMLIAFSPGNGLGGFLRDTFGFQLVFSFGGLVFASILYSLPFMVHPIQAGFSNLPQSYRESAYVIGKNDWQILWKIMLPNIKPSLLTGIVLAFAHTIGEFGVVLMIGGNIPGKTKVASIAIYDEVEAMNYGLANQYSVFLFIVCFLILLVVYFVNGNFFGKLWK